jgi:hypothetical protein
MATLKQGEAKTITLTVTENEEAVDLSTATLTFGIRNKHAAIVLVTIADADFNKTQAAAGIVSIFLTGTHTNQVEGEYVGELKAVFPGSPQVIEKSADLAFSIKRAIL